MFKRWMALLATLMLMLTCAHAESWTVTDEDEAPSYAPIPWSFDPAPYAPHEEGYLPDNGGYHDDSIDVRIETFRRDDTTVWAAYITLTDASQFRTGLAGKYPGKATKRVGDMAKRLNAVIAINGDYFNYHSQGIVVRNGKQLRNQPHKGRDTLIVDDKGDFTILSPTTREAWEAFEGTVMHAFCFGPGLVIDGVALSSLDQVKIDAGVARKSQRMAIGQLGPLQYLILTCEGPENDNCVGFDLLQMAALCQEMGCVNAYNLDGGSSSTIALKGKKINALSSGKVRLVGDCIYFATLVP